METAKIAWGPVVGLPSAIIAVAVAAFPEWAAYLLGAMVIIWVGAVISYLLLQNRRLDLRTHQLEAEVQKLETGAHQKPGPIPPPAPSPKTVEVSAAKQPEFSWEPLEEVTLTLDGRWEATRNLRVIDSDKLRITANGAHRFTLHLVAFEDLPRKTARLRPLESSSEGTEVVTFFDIPRGGEYCIAAEPSGAAPFRVHLRIEQLINK